MEAAWTTGLLRLLARQQSQLFTIGESERALDTLLTVTVAPSPGSARKFHLEEFASFVREPQARAVLQRLTQELIVLGTRANPVYRSVVGEYQQIAFALTRQKTRRLAERLARLKSLRVELGKRGTEIDDYMNWFEATQARSQSGLFADYLRAAELAAMAERPHRRDPISIYLTMLESQLQE